MYRKTKLACSVAAVLASAISANSAFAQDAQPNNDLEVIEVSGIRSSVAKSMDVKRSSAGVVDAEQESVLCCILSTYCTVAVYPTIFRIQRMQKTADSL